MSQNEGKRPYYWTGSLARGLRIVELLAKDGGMSVTGVSRALNMDRAGCNRMLLTLRDLGYTTQKQDKTFGLTPKLLELSKGVPGMTDIRQYAKPYMNRLVERFGQTVNLGQYREGEIVTIDLAMGSGVLSYVTHIGQHSPAYTTAMGKCILANMPEDELSQYMSGITLQSRTVHTITDPDRLMNELERVRRRGWALDDMEWDQDLRCAAVPIFTGGGVPGYAMSVTGHARRMPESLVEEIADELKKVSEALSGEVALGG